MIITRSLKGGGRRALALFADYAPDEFEHPDGAAAGVYAAARHPEAGRDCRLCGAGRAVLFTFSLLELAADHHRAGIAPRTNAGRRCRLARMPDQADAEQIRAYYAALLRGDLDAAAA